MLFLEIISEMVDAMDFSGIIQKIGEELKKPLPGLDVQLQMSSMRRIRELLQKEKSVTGVKSSVLILLYPSPGQNDIQFVLTKRPDYDGVHGGQISLPGGRAEDSDATAEMTALRESSEEIGSDISGISIIGALSELYIPPSNYLVMPFVGFTAHPPHFRIDPREVEEVLEVTLKELLDDDLVKWKDIYVRPGMTIFGPCFEINRRIIWGATAMILNEFKEILKRIPELYPYCS